MPPSSQPKKRDCCQVGEDLGLRTKGVHLCLGDAQRRLHCRWNEAGLLPVDDDARVYEEMKGFQRVFEADVVRGPGSGCHRCKK
jgi:hypothetical protein